MGTYTEQMHIAVPPDEVCAYRLDFTNLPAYNPAVSDLERVDDGSLGPPGVGATYRFRVRIPPGVASPVTLTVTEVDAPKRVAVAIDAMFDATEECVFEPDGDGTLLTFTTTVDTPGGPLRPLLDRLFVVPSGRRQVRDELRRMQAILETDPERS